MLVALVNFLFACSSITEWTRAEFEQNKRAEQSPAKIIAVILSSGDIVRFDDDGGEYDSCRDLLIGMDPDGQLVEVPAKGCRLRVATPEQYTTVISAVTTDSYRKKYAPGSKLKIAGVVLNSGDVIDFYRDGGRLNANGTTICGRDANECFHNIDLAEANTITFKRTDAVGSWLILGGILGFVALALVMADFDRKFPKM